MGKKTTKNKERRKKEKKEVLPLCYPHQVLLCLKMHTIAYPPI